MFRIFAIVLFVLVLIVGLQFAAVNSEPVTVDYFLGSVSVPLSLVAATAFAAGVLLTLVLSLAVMLPLRMRLAGLRRQLSDRAQELGTLRKRLGSGPAS